LPNLYLQKVFQMFCNHPKDVITLAIADWIAIDNYKIERFLNGYD